MAQVPKIGANHDIGHDLIGQRRRDTECRFVLPVTQIGASGLGLVKQIEPPEQAILDEFGIRFEFGFKAVVHDLRAACLVTAVKFRFERQRHSDWRRIAINQDRAKFGLEAINCSHVAVVETWNTVNVVIGDRGTKYDLHVLRWRKFIFKRGLADAVASAAALAKIGFCFRLMYLVSTSWNAPASCARAANVETKIVAAVTAGTAKNLAAAELE